MSDVKVEYEQVITRDEAAALLSQLATAFTADGAAEFPFGPSTVKLDVPGTVGAELEVEVEDDQVEIEIEFKWPLKQRRAEPTAGVPPRVKMAGTTPERGNGAVRPAHAGRAKRK